MTEPADSVGGAAGALEQLAHLLGNALDFFIEWLVRPGPFRLGREDHAGQRIAPAEGVGADLVRPAGHPPHVVQAGTWIEQAFVPQAIHFEFALEEGGQLEKKCLAVERLAQELPGTRTVRFEPLGAT